MHATKIAPDRVNRIPRTRADRLILLCAQVLLIGTDIPSLTSAVMDSALAALKQHEAVVGPSVDGGFYLLGVTRLAADFLQVCHFIFLATKAVGFLRRQDCAGQHLAGQTVMLAQACQGTTVVALKAVPLNGDSVSVN